MSAYITKVEAKGSSEGYPAYYFEFATKETLEEHAEKYKRMLTYLYSL